ncbi:winged helix-turn-helix domain-containing protein [Saccharothrix obliqua]|uniref:winged helix-turn-helix domain-containing protein n=1 Tax=Saccharothrix obliqua TaxID=2861747 RepID=UPI001C604BE6|nr:winged helix-turn-helix domain-containing protein [Saccharothrix obliqua]MBW4717098.1 winged helix-turn-helix domain-containing protein [Saccharothrix obliqua]
MGTEEDLARAHSHPVRLALLDLLAGGPLTATRAAAELGTNSGATSFHLRRLARFGLVEAVDGAGREKPWRLVGGADVADALDARDDRRYARWRADRDRYPARWRRQAATAYTAHLTPDEVDALAASILDLVAPYFDRADDPASRPPDAVPVALVTRLFPLVTPEELPR